MKDSERTQIHHINEDLLRAKSGGAALRLLGTMFRESLAAIYREELPEETLDAT